MLHFKPLGQQTTLGLTSLLGDRFPLGQWHPLGSELQTALGQWHPLGSQFQNTSIEAFDSTLSQSWHDREFVQSESPEVRGTSRQYSRVSSPKTSLELDVLPLEKISSIEPLQSIRSIVSPSVRETVNSKIPSSSTSSLRIPQRTAAPLQFLSPERVSAREQDVEPRSLQRFEPQDRESIDPNLSFSELQSKIQLKHSPGDTSKPQNTETTTPSIQERATILDSEADVSESLDRSSSLRSSEISERVLPLQTQLESEDITTIPPETGEKEDEPSPIQKQIQRQSEFLDRDLDRTDSESSSILESPSPENSDIETISTEIAEAVEPDETALSIQPQPSIPPSESNFSDRSISPTPPERPELTISPQEQLESEDITTIPPETGEKQTEPSPTQKQIQRQPELPIRDLERVESRSPGVPSPPTPRNLETEPSISPTLDRKDRDIQASPELKPGIPQPSADTIETQQDAEARVTENESFFHSTSIEVRTASRRRWGSFRLGHFKNTNRTRSRIETRSN
ncbi:MAG: hypothetical protein J7641_17525 [Cyanobacteria bacterium SID2]|nr:hypothetical protein [Cyanobacteria bacterium SID2]